MSTAYRPDTNQHAESAVKRAKRAINWKLSENPSLKINDPEIQSLIHDLAHETMQGQLATPHQCRYLTLGQDDKIEVNQRVDQQEVRSHFLYKTLDMATEVPGDGSLTLDPARRRTTQAREHAKHSDFEVFERGNAVSIKEEAKKPVRLGWIIDRAADDVTHDGTPFERTACRRYRVELKVGDGPGPQPHTPGEVIVDAQSMKRWNTSERPRFMLTEEEERQLRESEEEPRRIERPREPENQPTMENEQQQTEQVEPMEQQETPIVTEIQQPKRAVGRPRKTQQPQQPQQTPREGALMDGGNHCKQSEGNIMGESEGPRTTRSGRPAAAHLANDLNITQDQIQSIFGFISHFSRFMNTWTASSNDPDQDPRQRDNERQSGETDQRPAIQPATQN